MIDRTALTALRQDVGIAAFGEIIDLFVQEIDPKVDQLRKGGVPSADDLHFLRSGAMNLGLSDFASACAAGERLAEAGHQDQIDIADLLRCYDRSRAALLGEFAFTDLMGNAGQTSL